MLKDTEIRTIDDGEKLKNVIGEPKPAIANKEMQALDKHMRHFISLCPFLCISTADAAGNQDISPRGDPAGFVKVLDDTTILIPDRKGNRRVDTMQNLLENPNVGLLLFLPGVDEVVRINGQAVITDDPDVLKDCAVSGVTPNLGILVKIDDVFFHCAKAIIRSQLWNPKTPIDRKYFPLYGEIVRDQREPDGDPIEIDDQIKLNNKVNLY